MQFFEFLYVLQKKLPERDCGLLGMMKKSVEDLLNGRGGWVETSLHIILNAMEEVGLYSAEANAATLI